MVTRVEHQIGSWARPIPADRWRTRSAPVDAAVTRPTLVASPPSLDVPQFPTDGVFLNPPEWTANWRAKCRCRGDRSRGRRS